MSRVDDARLRAGAFGAPPPAGRGAWVSHPGHRRPSNDDRAAVGDGWAAVADGVGSIPGSGSAAEVAVAEFGARARGIASVADAVDAVRQVNDVVLAMARAGDLPPAVATTLVGAVATGSGVIVVGVGDSPAWSLAGGAPPDVRLVCAPQRRWDPLLQSFTLLQAIGAERPPEPNVAHVPVGEGVRIVLASDGVLEDEPGAAVPSAVAAAAAGDAPAAARAVLDHALRGSAADNVTVAVLDLGVPQFGRAG
jgi:serine/threonine protein phosphatase PrpC